MSFSHAQHIAALNQDLGSDTRDIRVSFEFFPPKTEQMEQQLWRAFDRLAVLNPSFVSVTYGALSGERERTHQVIKQVQAKTQIANFETALDTFEIDVGRYPTSSEGLDALVDEPSNAEGWQQAYLKQGIPLDPWGEEYIYKIPGSNNEEGYDLYSKGPDRKSGGDDDIKNWLDDDERSD